MNRVRQQLRRLQGEDGGNASMSTAVGALCVLLLFGLLIAFGRVALAQGAADSAARAAARTASLERVPEAAEQRAREAALTSLTDSGVRCAGLDVAVDTSGLSAPVGATATVDADVVCTARLSDIGLPGLPGSKDLEGTMTSVVDRYRGRGPS